MADRDIAKKRRRNLERFHQRTAERRAAGQCLKCGNRPSAPERTLCESCLDKRRAADRARTARLRNGIRIELPFRWNLSAAHKALTQRDFCVPGDALQQGP